MSNSKMVKVLNRSRSTTIYVIPDYDSRLNVRREFTPGEVKMISEGELRALSYAPGGKTLLSKYLVILDEETVDEIVGAVEPEYFYTEEQIQNILVNGTLEELEDTITFGGSGVHSIIKHLAVKLKLESISKRELILKKLSFNVTSAIEIAEPEVEVEDTRERKAGTPKAVATPAPATVRKTVAPAATVPDLAETPTLAE